MGLLDLFNQWIVEHGSAVVQEKHLALFRDQLVALEKKALVLESENAILKATVEQLTENNEKLRQEIQRRDDIIQKDKSHNNLPDEQMQVLTLLAKSGLTETKIITAIDRNAESIRFDLEELKMSRLIESQHWGTGDDFFSLTQDGRRYLKRKGII